MPEIGKETLKIKKSKDWVGRRHWYYCLFL